MPIIIPEKFPAYKTLTQEGLFLMKEKRANTQDIRPLKILVLNLMPLKIRTEKQLLRLISNSMIQIDLTFIHPKSHVSKNTDINHLDTFYKTFDDIKDDKFDGMIITGAPVEHLEFEEVDYWEELQEIMDYTEDNVTATMFICWAAQAGLYHFYNIPKHPLENKLFGVFQHKVVKKSFLINGFDDTFVSPHSRHTEVRKEDIEKEKDLLILAESEEAGVYIVKSKKTDKIFITGHFEYDDISLHEEYIRDLEKGLSIEMPVNYYPGNDSSNRPENNWRSHATLLFANWLNYYVYQVTDFELE